MRSVRDRLRLPPTQREAAASPSRWRRKRAALLRQRAGEGAVEARHGSEAVLLLLRSDNLDVGQELVRRHGTQGDVVVHEEADSSSFVLEGASGGLLVVVERRRRVHGIRVDEHVAERGLERAAEKGLAVEQVVLVKHGRREHQRLQVLNVQDKGKNVVSQLGWQWFQCDGSRGVLLLARWPCSCLSTAFLLMLAVLALASCVEVFCLPSSKKERSFERLAMSVLGGTRRECECC